MSGRFYFPFVFTTAGLAAIANAAGNGLSLNIAHLAVGTGQYSVVDGDGVPLPAVRSMTALQGEVERVPFLAGEPGENRLALFAEVPAGDSLLIGELGIIDDAGVLVAVASRPGDPFGYRGDLATWQFDHVLSWVDLPSDALTIVTSGTDVSVALQEARDCRDGLSLVAYASIKLAVAQASICVRTLSHHARFLGLIS